MSADVTDSVGKELDDVECSEEVDSTLSADPKMRSRAAAYAASRSAVVLYLAAPLPSRSGASPFVNFVNVEDDDDGS